MNHTVFNGLNVFINYLIKKNTFYKRVGAEYQNILYYLSRGVSDTNFANKQQIKWIFQSFREDFKIENFNLMIMLTKPRYKQNFTLVFAHKNQLRLK